jgi:diadenosine tetraphosphate (Ap4A) HIT family hydrolase
MVTQDCVACSGNDRIGHLRPRDAVVVTEHWRVAHGFDSMLLGWLVVIPRRHVAALHELTDEEVAPLGVLLRRLSEALSEVTGCEKAYVAFFAEKEGFSHLHIHVVPRMADFTDDVKGHGVFTFLQQDEAQWLPARERDTIAMQLRAALHEDDRA